MTDYPVRFTGDSDDLRRAAREASRSLDRFAGAEREAGRAGVAVERSADRQRRSLGGLGRALRSSAAGYLAVAAGAAVLVAGGVRLAAAAVRQSADLAETESRYRTVLGASADLADGWIAAEAAAAGLSRRAGQELIATSASIAQGFGFTEAGSRDLAIAIADLGADLSSFHNLERGTAQAVEILNSALTGEREQLKQLGIVIQQADVDQRALRNSVASTASELTNQDRALASLELIYERAGAAVGDLDRTSDSAANRLRAFNAQLTDVRERALGAAGEGILGSLLPALDRISAWVDSNGADLTAVFADVGSLIGEAVEAGAGLVSFLATATGSRANQAGRFLRETVPGLSTGTPADAVAARDRLAGFRSAVGDVGLDRLARSVGFEGLEAVERRIERFARGAVDVDDLADAAAEAAARLRELAPGGGGGVTLERPGIGLDQRIIDRFLEGVDARTRARGPRFAAIELTRPDVGLDQGAVERARLDADDRRRVSAEYASELRRRALDETLAIERRAERAADAIEGAFRTASGAVLDLLTGLRVEWDRILASILRSIVEIGIIQPLGESLGTAVAGAFGGGAGGAGGPVAHPTIVINIPAGGVSAADVQRAIGEAAPAIVRASATAVRRGAATRAGGRLLGSR